MLTGLDVRGAPAAIVQKLHDATVQAMNTPAVRDQLQSLGSVIVTPDRRSPDYLAGFVKSERGTILSVQVALSWTRQPLTVLHLIAIYPLPGKSGLLALRPEGPMTSRTRSSDGLDVRRRKLLFRAWHRGMREMDLIMGRFADTAIGDFTERELAEFEELIEQPDRELLAWITGETDVPTVHDTSLFRRLRDFNRRGEGAR